MVEVHKKVNNTPDVSFGLTLLFLVLARPIFVGGFALMILPIILGNQSTKPVAKFMAHEYWVY